MKSITSLCMEINKTKRFHELKLERLSTDKLEVVRNWRNTPEVQQFMEYREHITSKMQKRWFERINNLHNYYFILSADGNDIGLMNIKDVNFDTMVGEKGSLIWDTSYRNQGIGTIANYMMLNFAFHQLKLRRLIIHILRSNDRSRKVYENFGFVISSGQQSVENQEYSLSSSDFFTNEVAIEKEILRKYNLQNLDIHQLEEFSFCINKNNYKNE